MRAKRRSDIRKLITAARDIWRQSETYQLAKKAAAATRKGWFRCAACAQEREVIKVDHIQPIGKEPAHLDQFGQWLVKLFCPLSNLQCLDKDCHHVKTKADKKKKYE